MHFKKFVYGRKNWKNFRCSTISKLWDSPLWDTMLFLNCGIYETFITQEMLYLNDCSFVKNTTFNTMECYSVVKRNSFEQAPGDSEEQGSLACCSPWGYKVSRNLATNNKTDTFSNMYKPCKHHVK